MRSLIQAVCTSLALAADPTEYASEQQLMEHIPRIKVGSIKSSDIEAIVNRQWFDAAGELVKKSHEEGVDISAPIRNGVANIRSKLDNLVKLLDPEYVRPQIVNPAFQWAQSDTTIFILLKYSRRFNAPGAVEVDNLNCTFTPSAMYFSAIGEHSGKRFEYQLNLDFFDMIDPDNSKWTPGSVGKITITIAKSRVTRWPRLLVANTKIDNMHHWFDYGEKLESSLAGLPDVAESGLTCKHQNDQFYCLTSDSCKESCSECKGKKIPNPSSHTCEGPPAFGAKEIVFSDSNPAKDTVGGTVEVHLKKDHHKHEIEFFNLYLVPSGTNLTSSDSVWVKSGPVTDNITKIDVPETTLTQPMDILAIPGNSHGERRALGVRKSILDLYAPTGCGMINDLAFTDTDGDKNSVKGMLTFTPPTETDGATHIVFYWGKDEFIRLVSKAKSSIAETSIGSGKHNLTSSTIMPSGATHILGYAKSSGGESENPIAAVAIEDRYRPQSEPAAISLTDGYAEITRAPRETEQAEHVTEYVVRVTDGTEEDLDRLPMEAVGDFDPIPGVTKIPEKATKICAYLVNEMGRAKTGVCVDTSNNIVKEEL